MKTLLITTILAAGIASNVIAAPLSQAMTEAYQSNNRLKAAKFALQEANEGYVQARAGWLPTISADASIAQIEQDSEVNFSGASDTRTPKTMGINLSQPIYRGGRTVAQTDASLSEISRARSALDVEEQAVLLDTVTAYMDVLRAIAVVTLNEQNERFLATNLNATQSRFEVGEVTKTDVAQAESRLASAKAATVQSVGELRSAEATYFQVVNKQPTNLQKPDVVVVPPASKGEAIKIALDENPELAASWHSSEAAKHLVDREIGGLLPEINVSAGYEKAEDSSVLGGSQDTFQATARLSIPLFEGGANYSRVRQAQYFEARAKADLQNQQRIIRERVVRAWEGLQTARAQKVSLQSAIRAATIALDGVKKEAEVGARTVLDILDAEQELLDAKVNLVTADRNEVVATYGLLASVGRLTVKDIGLKVAAYDPEQDLDNVRNKFFGFANGLEE